MVTSKTHTHLHAHTHTHTKCIGNKEASVESPADGAERYSAESVSTGILSEADLTLTVVVVVSSESGGFSICSIRFDESCMHE